MKFNVKSTSIVIAFGLSVLSFQLVDPPEESHVSTMSTVKATALEVLELRCNSCHRKQNPWKIFKEKNMDRFAPKIYEQVFLLERMPKGADNSLTPDEMKSLLTWLNTQTKTK